MLSIYWKHHEYNKETNDAYKEKYDALDASNEEVNDE